LDYLSGSPNQLKDVFVMIPLFLFTDQKLSVRLVISTISYHRLCYLGISICLLKMNVNSFLKKVKEKCKMYLFMDAIFFCLKLILLFICGIFYIKLKIAC
jgi:hypothetical protein